MSDDLRDLLKCLKSAEVEFMVVGSHVLAKYARPRFTEDLDLWIRSSRENALALAEALRQFGFAVTDEQALRLASGRNMIRLGEPPNRVDILGFLGEVESPFDFSDVVNRAVPGDLLGVEVPFLSKEDFVRSKMAANRPKDQADLAELREYSKD